MRSAAANLEYTMPAEWDPHEGAWLQWPRNKDEQPLVLEGGAVEVNGSGAFMATRYSDAANSNYLVANGVVPVPVLGNIYDDRAKQIIGEQFRDREIVAIDAFSLMEDGGAIDCITQQQPAAGVNGRQ